MATGGGDAIRTGRGGGEAIRSGLCGVGEATRTGFGGGDVVLSVAVDETWTVDLGGDGADTGVGRLVGRGAAGGSFGGLRPGAIKMDATFVSNSPVSNITGISRDFDSSCSLSGRVVGHSSDSFTFDTFSFVDDD